MRPSRGPLPTLGCDEDTTGVFAASDATGMLGLPSNRRAERRRTLIARVVAGCDELRYAHIPKDRALVIGRDAACDLIIDHPSVSRRHATITVDPRSGRIVVTDLDSRNGTWLGAARLAGAEAVNAGDRVEIGFVSVRLEQLADEELAHLDRVAKKLLSSGVDALTGLATRSWLQDSLPVAIAEHRNANLPLTGVFLDIDHFKSVNDTFGHAVGDAVLRTTAKVILSSIRTYDVGVRYGGEEFLVVLLRTTTATGMAIAERVRTGMLAIPWKDHGLNGRGVTISCGVAQLRDDEDSAMWLKRADDALYDAKSGGRNQVVRAA